MNVDRLPESDNDPRPTADTTHLTEPPQPDNPAPELEPDQHRTPDHQPPSERQPERDPKPGREPEPERDQLADSRRATAQADSPAISDNSSEPAEPRTRQEQANYPSPLDAAPQPADRVDRTHQENAPPVTAPSPAGEDSVELDDLPPSPYDHLIAGSEDSTVQEELLDEAGTEPDRDTGSDEMPPQEGSPETLPAHEFTPRKETDQQEIDDANSNGSGRVDTVSDQEVLPDKTDTRGTTSQHQEASKSNDDATLADDRTDPLAKEWTEHLVEVREGLDSARRDGLISKRLHTIDGAGEIWTEERELLHDSIIEDLYAKAANVPSDFKAIMAGGLGGAGKTTILTQYAGIDMSQYLMINPDDMKEEMARRAMIPEVRGLSPMEASELVHEESSYLANQLALRAQSDGKNLIWDITMSSKESVTKRINELTSAGYTHIAGVFVDIPVEISLRRIESRHREGHSQYRAGNGLGGRYVPPEVIESQRDQEWGNKNMRAFDAVKQRFSNWSIYDNSVDGRRPVLVEASSKQQFAR